MPNPVVLKSNRYGIKLVLDSDMDFEELLKSIIEKFQESESFFRNARMAISFEGRELTQEEECQIVAAITEHTSIEVVCILDEDPEREEMVRQRIEEFEQAQYYREEELYEENYGNSGEFYKGTLRSGQVLDCESSIVIVGDVNTGAKVVSGGNIFVLGAIKGNAFAGAHGNEQSIVAALEMDPIQIRIGGVIGRSADKAATLKKRGKKKAVVVEPQVAIVKDKNIYIEPITKGLLNNL